MESEQPCYNSETTQSIDHGQQNESPCLWKSPSNEVVLQNNATVTISMFRPRLYDYFLASPNRHPFGPSALRGHAEVDVFTWGLLFVALDDAISKASRPARFALWISLSVFGLGLFCGILIMASSLLSLLLYAVVTPMLMYELAVATWIAPNYHASCQQVVHNLGPIIMSKCGYRVEYHVTAGRFFGSTSELRVSPPSTVLAS